MHFLGRNILVHITTYGHGKKQLLCLHGFASSGMETFKRIIPHISREYQVVLVDWIGFGKTTKLLEEKDTYNHTYLTEWLTQFITSARKKKILKKRFSIAAVSMSGLMTGLAYHEIKEFVEKIVFVNPAGFDHRISMKYSMVFANPLLKRERFLKIISRPLFWKRVLGLNDRHKKKLESIMHSGELEVYSRCARNSMNARGKINKTHICTTYQDISCPVLLVCSTRDTMIIDQEYVRVAEKFGWSIVRVRNDDHVLIARKPRSVAKAIKEFL